MVRVVCVGMIVTLGLVLYGCGASKVSEQPEAKVAEVPEAAKKARPELSWVKARVAAAKQRLDASEGGKLVWAAIEAQGGLERWYSSGPIAFRFTYQPDGKPARDTSQLVDTWSARAVHTMPDGGTFGWDGKRAWKSSADVKMNARFWSLTPYYFVGIPFVLADEGVVLKREGEAEWDGKKYDLVRATFTSGTGDAPEDFYVLYIHQQTRRVEAIRYIVTYKGFFPNGGHSPEKFFTYDGSQEVGGITLPTGFRTFAWDGSKPVGEPHTRTTLTNVSFRPETPRGAFDMPKGAVVQDKP